MTKRNSNLELDLLPAPCRPSMTITDVFFERIYCFNTNWTGYNVQDRATHYGLSPTSLRFKLMHEYTAESLSDVELTAISQCSGFTPDFIRQVLTFSKYPEFGHRFKLELVTCLSKEAANAVSDLPTFRLGQLQLTSAEVFAERCLLVSAFWDQNGNIEYARNKIQERIDTLNVQKEDYYLLMLGVSAASVPHPGLRTCVNFMAKDFHSLNLSKDNEKTLIDLAKRFKVSLVFTEDKKVKKPAKRVVTALQVQNYSKIMSDVSASPHALVVLAEGRVHAYTYADPFRFKVYEKTEKDGRTRIVSWTVDGKTVKCPLDIMVFNQYGSDRLRAGDVLCHLDGDLANNDIRNLRNLTVNPIETVISENSACAESTSDQTMKIVSAAHHKLAYTLVEVLQNPKNKLLLEINENGVILVTTAEKQITINDLGGFEAELLEGWLRKSYLT